MAYQILESHPQLQSVHISHPVLNPVEAEIRIALTFEQPFEEVHFRGRLTGPRCAFSESVEIAYYFKPAPGVTDVRTVTGRIVIPEPCFWEPEMPFLYQGMLEVVSGEELLVRIRMQEGLRLAKLGQGGLHWNGKRLKLNLRSCDSVDFESSLALRESGFNGVVAPMRPQTMQWLESTDQYGMLAIVYVDEPVHDSDSCRAVAEHASFVAWLVSSKIMNDEATLAVLRDLKHYIGVEMDGNSDDIDLSTMHFLCCRASKLDALEAIPLPKLIVKENGNGRPIAMNGILGTIS